MSEAKKETAAVSAMTAAEYRRKIIRMVSDMEDVKSLEFIYSFAYPFYRDDASGPETKNDLFSSACWLLAGIRNPKYLETIYNFVRRLFLKPDSGAFKKGGDQA